MTKHVFFLQAVAGLAVLGSTLVFSVPAHAQQPTARPLAPAALPPGWEQVDQRMVFLTVQLSSAETSLRSVNNAIRATGYQQTLKQTQAQQAVKGNEIMDRNAGGPVAWSEFYGSTAEKFFYHPTENTTYHTQTILTQQASKNDAGGGIAPASGLPVHQRPPQFDYIYRANQTAQQQAEQETAKLGGQIDKLLQRQRELETEQSALWCKIAFQAVIGRELMDKPLYRFDFLAPGQASIDQQRLNAICAAAAYVRTSTRLVDATAAGVDNDAAASFEQLQKGTASCESDLHAVLIDQLDLSNDARDTQTTLGKLAAVAKRMKELSTNIAEAQRLIAAAEKAGDDGRKNTFRSVLQQSLVTYSETVLAEDECVMAMVKDWKMTLDRNARVQLDSNPAFTVQAVAFSPTAAEGLHPEFTAEAVPHPSFVAPEKFGDDALLYKGHHYKIMLATKSWNEAEKACEEIGGHLAVVQTDELRVVLGSRKGNKLLWVGCSKINDKWVWVDGSDGPPGHILPGPGTCLLYARSNQFGIRPENGVNGPAPIDGFICEWDK